MVMRESAKESAIHLMTFGIGIGICIKKEGLSGDEAFTKLMTKEKDGEKAPSKKLPAKARTLNIEKPFKMAISPISHEILRPFAKRLRPYQSLRKATSTLAKIPQCLGFKTSQGGRREQENPGFLKMWLNEEVLPV